MLNKNSQVQKLKSIYITFHMQIERVKIKIHILTILSQYSFFYLLRLSHITLTNVLCPRNY